MAVYMPEYEWRAVGDAWPYHFYLAIMDISYANYAASTTSRWQTGPGTCPLVMPS